MNIFKLFGKYKSELYGVGKRQPLNHKEKQKRKKKRRINKRNQT